MDQLEAFKRTIEVLGYELEIVKKSAEDVVEASGKLPPDVRQAIGDIKIIVELPAAEAVATGIVDGVM